MKSLEQQLAEKDAEIRELRKSVITQQLSESGLPEAAQARVRKRLHGSETTNEIKNAIAEEANYLRAVRASKKPAQKETDQATVELVESYKRMGLSEKEARIAAGVESSVENISESRRALRESAKLLGLTDSEADAFSRM